MSQITIERAVKTYGGGVTALHGIDLTIEDGELLVLVGPSGCGKSTLLRMIAGLESVTSGSIAIDGTVVNDMAPAQRDIAMVFQNYALYPHMTVRGNLEYGLKNRKVPAPERRDLVDEAARILELTPYLDRKPSALSGGQRQRVAMGRAIVRKPRAFLFDEPLSNLDAKLRGHMRVEIRKLQRSLGTTSIFVTHDQLEAMTLADRLVVMKDGQIEQIGTPWEVYNTPATTFVARFIGAPGMNILERAQIGADAMPPALAPGKSLIGFRPEVAKLGWNGGALRFKGEIEGVEIIGPESLFHVRVPNAPDPLVVRLPTDPAGPMTGTISFEVEQENIRQFDH